MAWRATPHVRLGPPGALRGPAPSAAAGGVLGSKLLSGATGEAGGGGGGTPPCGGRYWVPGPVACFFLRLVLPWPLVHCTPNPFSADFRFAVSGGVLVQVGASNTGGRRRSAQIPVGRCWLSLWGALAGQAAGLWGARVLGGWVPVGLGHPRPFQLAPFPRGAGLPLPRWLGPTGLAVGIRSFALGSFRWRRAYPGHGFWHH